MTTLPSLFPRRIARRHWVTRHFINGHFITGHFIADTLSPGHFTTRTLYNQATLSQDTLSQDTFFMLSRNYFLTRATAAELVAPILNCLVTLVFCTGVPGDQREQIFKGAQVFQAFHLVQMSLAIHLGYLGQFIAWTMYYLKRGVINFLLTCLSYPRWSIIIMLYRWLGRVENRLSIVFTLFKTAILTAFLCTVQGGK